MAINAQMPQTAQPAYNPRWFIWTIVFLVVAGISLVSYIVLSDTGVSTTPDFAKAKSATVKQPVAENPTPVKTK
jgi:hypothetical protein